MKQYTLDPEYVEQLELKNVERPPIDPAHSDPATFDLSEDQAAAAKMTFLRSQRLKAHKLKNECHRAWIRNPNTISEMLFNQAVASLAKIDREIYYRTHNIEQNKFDLQTLKAIPLDKLVEINRAGFFKLRDEKTPSVKWNKKSNRWHDFGSGDDGDSIDLIMRLYNLTFKEACNKLQTFI